MGDACAPATAYRRLSLWHETCRADWRPRAALDGGTAIDVGDPQAGDTGLGTAYGSPNSRPVPGS